MDRKNMDRILNYLQLWKKGFIDMLFITILRVVFVWEVSSVSARLYVRVIFYLDYLNRLFII